jgi:Carboxypeptidase regulatory-like domain
MRRLLGSACLLGAVVCVSAAARPSDSSPVAKIRHDRNTWLEVTPLGSFDPARLVALEGRAPEVRLGGWKAGPALVCAGGEGVAVDCEQRYLDAAPTIRPALAPGARVKGAVLAGSAPVRGARVALVPRRLTSRRLLTLPLALDRKTGAVVREVRTDAAGRFMTPELAPGDYRLEVNAPGGLILHGEPFTLPAREALLPKGVAAGAVEAALDLGAIVIPAGAEVEISVRDALGLPIAGAKVGGSQGDGPETTRFFEAETGPRGRAVLSGFDPARAASFACTAPGYLDLRQRFASPPAAVECTLARLGAIEGKVADEDGKPIAGATLSLAPGRETTSADAAGRFRFQGLAPAAYRLAAAAPGFRPERVSVELPAGESRKLAPMALVPGRELHGLVQDAATKAPVAGATLSAVDPPGAVASESGDDGTFVLATDDTERVALAVSAAG